MILITSEKNYIRGHIETLTAINKKYELAESKWFKPSDVISLLKKYKENKMFLSTAARQWGILERQRISKGKTVFRYRIKKDVMDEIIKINKNCE